MTGTPRLVATDLDGTLLGPDGLVSARTRAVLDALDAREIPVVFVTGRPVRWMTHLWEAVGRHGLAVCSNGGVVYDVAAGDLRAALTIAPAAARRVGRDLRRAVPGTAFAVERTTGFGREPAFLPRAAPPDEGTVASLEQLADDAVVKLLARHEELAPEEFWRRADAAVGAHLTTTRSSAGALVEMSARGVTKASTLEALCRELGVDRQDVVAFGDMPNDVPMLAWAGTSYAMADAHETARAAASGVAPPHEEDGVARVLTDLFSL